MDRRASSTPRSRTGPITSISSLTISATHEDAPRALGGAQDVLRVLDSGCDGLLDEHVEAGLEAPEGDLPVLARGRADGDGVKVPAPEEVFSGAVGAGPEPGGRLPGGRVGVGSGGESDPRDLGVAAGMVPSHGAEPDDGDPHGALQGGLRGGMSVAVALVLAPPAVVILTALGGVAAAIVILGLPAPRLVVLAVRPLGLSLLRNLGGVAVDEREVALDGRLLAVGHGGRGDLQGDDPVVDDVLLGRRDGGSREGDGDRLAGHGLAGRGVERCGGAGEELAGG